MLGVENAVALTNCTVALHLGMNLCDINPGAEVLDPSLTFVATCNAIRYVNAVPVLEDIKSYQDMTMNPDDFERKITSKTKAIVVIHFKGFSCNVDGIMEITHVFQLLLKMI